MPKIAVKDSIKIKRIIQDYSGEFTVTPKNQLFCTVCEIIVKHQKRHFIESHRKSNRHSSKKEISSIQTFLPRVTPSFATDVTKAFLTADIPLHKLNNPSIIGLFKRMGKDCPSESSCRSKVCELSIETKQRIKEIVTHSKIFIIIDESEQSGTKYFIIMVGCIENPSKVYLLDCIPLVDNIDNKVVCQIVDDGIRYLEIPRGDFVLLLSDAARYMTLAGSVLKNMYPNMFHVTCIAHLLHNCAMSIRSKNAAVDELISSIKLAVVKNAERRSLFNTIGPPPKPVLTRWATWLKAGLWYADKLPEIREIVNSFESKGLLVSRAKEAIQNSNLNVQLVTIAKYKPLIDLIVKTESSDYTIRDANRDIGLLNFQDDPCKVKEYIKKRLAANDISQIINQSRDDISPSTYALLQACQPTSAAVERSFSILKHLVRKDRNFVTENVRHYLIMACNGDILEKN